MNKSIKEEISKEIEINRLLDKYEIYEIDIKDIAEQFEADINNLINESLKEQQEQFEKLIDEVCDNSKVKNVRKDLKQRVKEVK